MFGKQPVVVVDLLANCCIGVVDLEGKFLILSGSNKRSANSKMCAATRSSSSSEGSEVGSRLIVRSVASVSSEDTPRSSPGGRHVGSFLLLLGFGADVFLYRPFLFLF